MTATNLIFLIIATSAFIAAASAAKSWAVSDGDWVWLCLTFLLYTIGNLIMIRLVKDLGLGIAISLSAAVQLAAINLLAVTVFGERLTVYQGVGVVLAVIAVAMIAIPGR